jgi:hypothetical protein
MGDATSRLTQGKGFPLYSMDAAFGIGRSTDFIQTRSQVRTKQMLSGEFETPCVRPGARGVLRWKRKPAGGRIESVPQPGEMAAVDYVNVAVAAKLGIKAQGSTIGSA